MPLDQAVMTSPNFQISFVKSATKAFIAQAYNPCDKLSGHYYAGIIDERSLNTELLHPL